MIRIIIKATSMLRIKGASQTWFFKVLQILKGPLIFSFISKGPVLDNED